jgi:hypothetical protein
MNKSIKHLRSFPRVSQLGGRPGATNVTAVSTPATQTVSISATPTVADTTTRVDINNQIEALAQRRAAEIIAEQQQSQILARNGRTFTRFDAVNDIIDNQTEVVTAGMWSDEAAILTTHFTGSNQTVSQRRYYVDVYQKNTSLTGSEVQYSIAYGNALGSGSDSQGQLNDSPARAIYSQYKQLLLNPFDSRFTTPSGSTDSIYVVNFKRTRVKEKLDPANFELALANITARDVNATGSVSVGTTVYTLIDDSGNSGAPEVGSAGRVFNIVSGSINSGVFNPTAPVYYGLVYPDYGVMILDGNVLDQQLGFATNVSSSVEGNNHFALYHSISGSSNVTNPATSDPYGFLARNAETITSTHFFVRIKNAEYNFSNNPSFTTGSVGEFRQQTFIGDPKVYVTTVGLYNDQRELLAVAKLSKPLLKSFSREALIRVKLDY